MHIYSQRLKAKVTRPCRHNRTNGFLEPVGTVQVRGQTDGGWSAKRSTDVVRRLRTVQSSTVQSRCSWITVSPANYTIPFTCLTS